MSFEAPNLESDALDAVQLKVPAAVLDAVGDAAAAYEDLRACGIHLHFAIDDLTGKLEVQVHDEQGTVLGVVAPSRVLDLASGAALEWAARGADSGNR
jgi:hypothetical protein